MSRKYHVTQQDIQDVLLARGQKVNINALVEFAKHKNILISSCEARINLARYVSTIPFDSSDIEFLYNLIEYDQRREKTTNSIINKIITEKSVRDAIKKIHEERECFNEVFRVESKPGSTTCIIEYEYDEEDFGKARMLQVTRKKVLIEIKFDGKKTIVRHPANIKCEYIVDNILRIINNSEDEPFEIKKIDLSHISNPDKRTEFFDFIMKNMEGMQPDDVTGIKIAHIDGKGDGFSEESEEIIVPGFIKKAALEGSSLLIQNEYQAFMGKGFFISNMKWIAVDNASPEKIKIEFEAGFSDQSNCRNFKYDIRGVYVTEKDSTVFIDRRRPATGSERIKYLSLLEKASELSIDRVQTC